MMKTADPRGPYFRPDAIIERHTHWEGDCLIWHGALDGKGYGHLTRRKKMMLAHRFVYENRVGPIPDGMTLDHVCHRRPCVNPDHLRLATRAQNQANMPGPERGKAGPPIRNVYQRGNKYIVQIAKGGVAHYYGTYASVDQAARIAEEKRAELFGEFRGHGTPFTYGCDQ